MGTSPGSFYVSLFIYCVAQSPQELSTGHKKVLQVKAGSCGVRVEARIIKREVGRQGETLQKGKKKKRQKTQGPLSQQNSILLYDASSLCSPFFVCMCTFDTRRK